MHMTTALPLRLALAAGGIAAALCAAPAGADTTVVFRSTAVRDLAQVLRNPVDDQPVVLRGHIRKRLSSDKYLFVSGGREIRVEIDHELVPAQRVAPDTLVEIEGEVEKDFLESPEIDVHRITVLE